MSRTIVIAEPGSHHIEMTREFNTTPEVLLRAFVEPELFVQWMGPRRLTTKLDKYDVRDGGLWRFIHADEDGNEFAFHGVFHGEPSIDGIVQTFEFEGAPGNVSLDRTTFEAHGGKTMLHQRSVFETVEARDAMIESGMESGVNDSFERLDELIETL